MMSGSVWLSKGGMPELAMDDIPLDANDVYALFLSDLKNGDFFMAAVASICLTHSTQTR